MKAPSANLLRMLRSADSSVTTSHASPRSLRRASTHSYTSQWKRGTNPGTRSPGRNEQLDQYFEDLLSQPGRKTAPASRTPPAAAAPPPPPAAAAGEAPTGPKTDREETLAKARIVFGSKLAGPGQRRRELDARSTSVAGVLVPPRPAEPDNCCMSGCVNCVWEQHRDELEEWAQQSAKARERLEAQREAEEGEQRAAGRGERRKRNFTPRPGDVASSMDDDGGGSEANWSSGAEFAGSKGDLFEGIPVGIREFMKQEKKLREKRREHNVS